MRIPGIGFRPAEVVLAVSVQTKRADTTFALFPQVECITLQDRHREDHGASVIARSPRERATSIAKVPVTNSDSKISITSAMNKKIKNKIFLKMSAQGPIA